MLMYSTSGGAPKTRISSCFQKKTQETPKKAIDLAKTRYRTLKRDQS